MDRGLSRKWRLFWHEPLACRLEGEQKPQASGVYAYRWGIETPWCSLRLHHWLYGDDERAQHDHPWNFYTFILKGGYQDLTSTYDVHGQTQLHVETMHAGKLSYRPATHLHSVHLWNDATAWTIVLTGPIVRRWGFFDGRRWWRSRKYFARNGAHPCT